MIVLGPPVIVLGPPVIVRAVFPACPEFPAFPACPAFHQLVLLEMPGPHHRLENTVLVVALVPHVLCRG